MDDTLRIQSMRRALQRTWYPFFARFPRPTEVQLRTWERLLAGDDVLVCSPTASGKTEAVLAPLVERHLGPGTPPGVRILVICPTRALVNDLARRIEAPLQRLNLRCDRRTGDHAHLDRERPPAVLVTTPESLDSLLVRHTSFLKTVRAIALDELHVLDGTARGDHLRLLLARLAAVVRKRTPRLQRVASSATVDAPDALAERYLSSAERVVVGGARAIDCAYIETPRPHDTVAALARVYGPEGAKKILVFAPSRGDVEQLAELARRWRSEGAHGGGRLGDRVYAHHGSLSREERERVERRFLRDPSAVCFATMTLELGIDIGDVDLVGLLGPPASVASYLQRCGRGNRRTGACRLLVFHRDPGDLIRLQHLEHLARTGQLCGPSYAFQPSVLLQQMGSLLLQVPPRWLAADRFASRLPAEIVRTYPEERLEELFRVAEEVDWLAPGRTGRSVAGPRLMREFERGTMHGNIPREARTVDVVDDTTGRVLGQVLKDKVPEVMANAGSKAKLALAGRSRRMIRAEDDRLVVATEGKSGDTTLFAPRGVQPLTRELALSLARHLAIPDDAIPWVALPGGFAVFHFQGSLAGTLLRNRLKKLANWKISKVGGLSLTLDHPPSAAPPPALSGGDLRAAFGPTGRRLERLAGAGPYHGMLPDTWRRDYLDDLIPVDEIAHRWTHAKLVEVDGGALWDALAPLAAVR